MGAKRIRRQVNPQERIQQVFNEACSRYIATLPPSDFLYHYCSLDTAIRILRSRELWASDLRKAKDPAEVGYGYEVLRRATERTGFVRLDGDIAAVHRGLCLHIACLSTELTEDRQWDEYADRGRGCAIGLHFPTFQELCKNWTGQMFYFPVVYSEEKQFEIFNEIIEKADGIGSGISDAQQAEDFGSAVSAALYTLVPAMKRPCCKFEHEWRIFFYCEESPFCAVDRPDKVCCRAVPVCGPNIVRRLILGPNSAKSIEDIQNEIRALGFEDMVVERRLSDGKMEPRETPASARPRKGTTLPTVGQGEKEAEQLGEINPRAAVDTA